MENVSEKYLNELYEKIWSKGKIALSNAQIAIDPVPMPGQLRWGLSAVLRPENWPSRLTSCINELAPILADGSFIYGPKGLHFTVKSFEGYRENVAEGDEYLQAYIDAISQASSRISPMTISLRGLVASPGGVLIKGWPKMDLQDFRRTMHESLTHSDLRIWGPESDLSRIRTSAHATLSIFHRADAQYADLINFVEKHFATEFGDITFDTIKIVGYRRTTTTVELLEYRSLPILG